jgi:Tol biopolymer transport system component
VLNANQFRVWAATVALAAGILVLITLVEPAEAAFPGSNGKIAFISDRTTGTGVNNPEGDYEIFAMNPDGTGLEQLTSNTAADFAPAWSADGRKLAWTSQQDGNHEIYMRFPLSIPGGDIFVTRRLTTNTAGDASPSFNHDGTKIAFLSSRDGNEEIYVMDTADTNPEDGNGDNPTNLTNNAAIDFAPAFSPDGTKIAFVSNRDGNYEIYVMDSDGTDPVNLTNNAAEDVNPNWSPDGTKIAFTSNRDGNLDIYVMDADGTEQKRLTRKAAGDYDPAWSPDGTKIAFTSTRGGGDNEIYVMKAKPESRKNRPKNLTKNDGVNDFQPDWRPVQ